MKIFLLLILLFIFSPSIHAQLHDVNWMLGLINNSSFKDVVQVSFRPEGVLVEKKEQFPVGFLGANSAVFSDSSGTLRAIFNGKKIYDATYNVMKNGDSIWYCPEPVSSNILAYADESVPQSGLFLLWPGTRDSLILFYSSQGYDTLPNGVGTLNVRHLQYALINLSGNNGLGQVVFRRKVILQDTLQYGRLIAEKHANGRDWWLPVFEAASNRYYRILIDPLGIHVFDHASVSAEITHPDGIGQAHFSPDGTLYAIACGIGAGYGDYLEFFDFDRCAGYFSNYRFYQYPENFMGCAFSPNGRFLYVNFNYVLYQYDLQSPNPDSTKVLISEVVPPPPGETTGNFYQMQLASDGKIYMSGTSIFRSLHVINRPDEPGLACQFKAYGLSLIGRNDNTITYSPNYRLGPLDGSSCDTLGLDNRPVAWFRYQRDTLDSLSVLFHDLSYYEPTSWSWDFGDGTPLSAERHPAHTYAQAGAYEVCLTVSNANATNTFCRKLFLGVTAAEDPDIQASISVFPNPFNTRLGVAESDALRGGLFRLFDLSGRLKRETTLVPGIREIDTGDLAAGMYFWEVRVKGERVASGKLVKHIE